VSRFLVLAEGHWSAALIPDGLPSQMRAWLNELWSVRPAPHWTHGPFHGIGERVRWKLAPVPSAGAPAYPRAILDAEIFLFAIAADLRQYGRLAGSPLATQQ
jgi:hypothetical protein